MYRAGQFLVEPGEFLGWFNPLGIIAVVVMLFNLFKLHEKYLIRLTPSVTFKWFGIGLGIGGALSIVSTLLMTTASLMCFGKVVEITGADVNLDRARVAGIENNQNSSKSSDSGLLNFGVRRGIETALKNKSGKVALVVGALLLIVGAGYACTVLELGFWGDFAAMSAGVALPEELTKAAVGLLLLYHLFDTKSLSENQFRRAVLAAFGIAGLGFGAGEALKYFGTYAQQDADTFWYGVRAVWCVILHGTWTLIVGAMLAPYLSQDPTTLDKKKADTFYMLLLASVPTAIAHGLYNTFCMQGGILAWVVGALSIFVAMVAIEGFLEDQPPIVPQPS